MLVTRAGREVTSRLPPIPRAASPARLQPEDGTEKGWRYRMSERNPEIERLVDSLQDSQISRRQFVTRAAGLGLSLPVIGGLLAANGSAATRRTGAASGAAASCRAYRRNPARGLRPRLLAHGPHQHELVRPRVLRAVRSRAHARPEGEVRAPARDGLVRERRRQGVDAEDQERREVPVRGAR